MHANVENLRKMSFATVLLFVIGLAYFGCASGPKVTPEQLAAAEQREKARQDSIKDFELKKNWSLGYENYKNKEYERVTHYFWNVIELDEGGTFKDVYSLLGQTYFQLGKADSALVVYEKGAKVYPDNEYINRQLGYLYETLQRPEEAIAAYEKVVKLKPDSEKDLDALGRLYQRVSEDDKARDVYKRLVDIAPENLEYRQIYTGLLGDDDEVLAQYMQLLEQDPNNMQVILDIVNLYRRNSNWPKATEYQVMAKKVAPEDKLIRKELAAMYKNTENYQKAISEYSELLNMDPNNAEILSEQAEAYKDNGQLQRARSVAQKSIRADRNYGKAYIVIAQAYEKAVDVCQQKANRAGANYYDKLVYEMASEQYKIAEKDTRFIQRAKSLRDALQPVLPTQGDRFLHKDKKLTDAAASCYHWIVK